MATAQAQFTITDLNDGRGVVYEEDWYKISNNDNETFDGENLIQYPYYQESHTENGITWTVGVDGTVTGNGTATQQTFFYLLSHASQTTLPAGEYKLYGCPSGGGTSNAYRIQAYLRASGSTTNSDAKNDIGTGQTFTVSSAHAGYFVGVRIIVDSGVTLDNLIFRPLLMSSSVATSGWGKTPLSPTADKKYLWFYEITTYSDGTTSTWGPVVIGTYGEQGAEGVGYVEEDRLYYLHTSSTTAPSAPSLPVTETRTDAGCWTLSIPAWSSGKYYWTCHQFKKTDNTYSITDIVYDRALTEANSNAETALTNAATAQATANSKSQVFYESSNPPSTGTYNTGDIWVKQSSSGTGGDETWYYDGSNWVKHSIGTTTIIDGSIITDKIATGAVKAGQIDADSINASNKLTVGAFTTDVQTSISNGTVAYNRATALRGTCSTTATTAAKVVVCAGFSLATGSAVTVYFSTANTKADTALTLNVNDTGAKTIYVANAATSNTNQLLWVAGSSITFVYDGNYWRVADNPGTWDGSACSIAAATAAKTSTASGIVVYKGVTVSVPMTYENTNSSATLNVSSLGAKAIYYGTGTTRPTTDNGRGWVAGRTVDFRFDGAYWRLKDTSTIIDGGHITTGTIDANKVTVSNIDASNITTGTIDASQITVTNIDANNITSGSIDASDIDVTNINADNITSGSIDASDIAVTNIDASNITTGTLAADRIELYGLMNVYKTKNGAVGGNLGYMAGNHGFSDGTKEASNGMAIVNEQAAKYYEATNLMPTEYRREKMSGSSWTSNGITWTAYSNGAVTATGTATGNSVYHLSGPTIDDANVPVIDLGSNSAVILSGCPSGGASSTFRLVARATASGTTPSTSTGSLYYDTGSGVTMTSIRYLYVYIQIYNGYTCPAGGITFYPMLETGSTKHSFVPRDCDGEGALASHSKTHYLIVTDSGVRMTEHNYKVNGYPKTSDTPNEYKVYLADGTFRVDTNTYIGAAGRDAFMRFYQYDGFYRDFDYYSIPQPIWENSSPSSSFGAQILTIPTMSNFNTFIICCRRNTSRENEIQTICSVPEVNGMTFTMSEPSSTGNTSLVVRVRTAIITRSNNTIEFSTGTMAGSTYNTGDGAIMIPTRILAMNIPYEILHSGELNDPYPFNNNLRLVYDKYYIQDNITYHCINASNGIVYRNLSNYTSGNDTVYVEVVATS